MSIYPFSPNFKDQAYIGSGFKRAAAEIDDGNNAVFRISLLGDEHVVNNYINNMTVIDMKLSLIEEKTFERILKNKGDIQENNLSYNKKMYKCLEVDNCTKYINNYFDNLKIDDDLNLIDKSSLNITIDLVKPYISWNYFFFEIDPPIDGVNENISSGLAHRYRQRFAQGRGFISLRVNGGECGLKIDTVDSKFKYYTERNDCQRCEWNAGSSKYQIIDVCGGRGRAGNYTVSGGWAFFSTVE